MQLPYRKPGKYSQGNTDPLMTKAKFDELTKKLERLTASQIPAAKEVSRLAELGDFSENVEYQLAKGKLRGINHGILLTQKQLDQAQLIAAPRQNERVEVGHLVTVDSGAKQKTFQILGSSESRPEEGIISQGSPIGTALLGRKIGEKVKVKVGTKEVEYTIISIE